MNDPIRRILTIGTPADAAWVMAKIRPMIRGKRVVELGAGIGILACEMALVAKDVIAVEPHIPFAQHFYNHVLPTYGSPRNLRWLVNKADEVFDLIHVDVAVIVTGSGVQQFRTVAADMASKVIMPVQQWKDGKATVAATQLNGEAFASLRMGD